MTGRRRTVPIESDRLPAGGRILVRSVDRQIALFRLQSGQLHAVDNQCPHEGYPLVKGIVKDCVLTCIWHNYKFRLDDGSCLMGDEAVRTYPVKESRGEIEVEIVEPPLRPRGDPVLRTGQGTPYSDLSTGESGHRVGGVAISRTPDPFFGTIWGQNLTQKGETMKRFTWLSLLLAGLVLCGLPAIAQAGENPGFEKMKSLVGEWEGLTEEGEVRISYRLVSDGTALMETLVSAGESEMVTIYTADGDRVALTHYCNENNQPRMQSGPINGTPKELAYSFVGGTNMAGPATPHMHNLVVSFEDGDQFTQKWTWRDKEKEMTTTFHFKRKKSS